MKNEILNKIVLIRINEKEFVQDFRGIKKDSRERYAVSCLSKKDAVNIEETYTADSINNILSKNTVLSKADIEFMVKDLKCENSVDSWMEENLSCGKYNYLQEKTLTYGIVVNDMLKGIIKKGCYTFNKIDYVDENNEFYSFSASEPIVLDKRGLSVQKKYNCTDVARKMRWEIPAEIVLGIIFKILPAFYESNVENELSFINMVDVGKQIFPRWLNLVLKYPTDYIDLCGEKNEKKVLVKNGVIENLIGYGDKVILDDSLNKRIGLFSIDVQFSDRNMQDDVKGYIPNKTTTLFDIKNGVLTGMFARDDKENQYVHNFNMHIVDFIKQVEAVGDAENLYGHSISKIMIDFDSEDKNEACTC